MSKLESPMTRWYWHTVGGLLREEFCLVERTAACGGRWADALVLPERGYAHRGAERDDRHRAWRARDRCADEGVSARHVPDGPDALFCGTPPPHVPRSVNRVGPCAAKTTPYCDRCWRLIAVVALSWSLSRYSRPLKGLC